MAPGRPCTSGVVRVEQVAGGLVAELGGGEGMPKRMSVSNVLPSPFIMVKVVAVVVGAAPAQLHFAAIGVLLAGVGRAALALTTLAHTAGANG